MDVDDRNARYTRYIIISITLEKYAYNDDMRNEKVLLLLDQARNVPVRAHLRDDWWHALVAVGDIVHIPSSPTTNTSNIIIDNENNYLIIHPDRLISCTAVADSFFCLRKSVLQQKIKSISEYSEVLVHGNIIHQVIQQALQAGDFSSEAIQETIQRVVLDSLDELYAIDQDEDTAIKILSMMAPEIKAFGEIYVGSEPKPWAKISDDVGPTVSSDMGCETLSINRILDIEEHLWSPTYGLKGMIDASIQVKASPCGKILTIPLELKTGKSNRVVSHRAQTILYTLLMSDRYDIIISAGALFYSRTNTFYLVPAVRNELRSLILARNELAAAMNTRQSLPQMVKRLHSCQRCNMNDACLIYHKATENGTRDSSGLGNWFEAKTAHLSEEHSAFFRHWQQLIDMEENDIDHFRKDIWQQEPDKREMAGKCFDHMVISKESMVANRNMASGCWYTFVRDPTQSEEIQQRSLLSSQISVGDPVVVSSRQGHINLGMGMVKRLSEHAVTISLTRPLRRPPRRADSFDLETCQTFIPLASDYGIHADIAQVGYRIDLDEMSGSMALMRRNLIAIVNKEEDGGDVKRRQLIVELTTPSFLPANSIRMPNIPNLNPDQRTAVETVLRAQDYTLVLGMPGTGKTTTTAHIIKALADQKKSVLLTAYTHTALDNVLVKIREAGIDVLRLACIGPLRYADVFVLVGDQYQLPPVVRDDQARENGLDRSLFTLLAKAHPEAVVFLKYQYRMNENIMTVSNQLIYNDKLRCGNRKVASQSLHLPQLHQGLDKLHKSVEESMGSPSICVGSSCWLKDVMDPR
ncbi:DNA replication factor Dna2-domain-containing protein [Radiomyces spectabilis]|uniref:DNA replication factor Dna2-domain-containing protein n=1 Tax=Radiomyces spectabilis TaxID=64574 RepID=UPI00221F2762|nr:DNA replication factor Dna2-domain-containing protein [Radiomyces spectabilis]KAI8384352.1 DNA replication factor Dna2-domain-containing protein [Radiomyces spectabilis]